MVTMQTIKAETVVRQVDNLLCGTAFRIANDTDPAPVYMRITGDEGTDDDLVSAVDVHSGQLHRFPGTTNVLVLNACVTWRPA